MKDYMKITRRSALRGAAGISALAMIPKGTWAQDGSTLTVRTDRGIVNLDPPYRTGQADGNAISAVFQSLISYRDFEYVWELNAAEKIEQKTPTEISFTLKPNQMFSDGYGEMTADDVKFSFERYIRPLDPEKPSNYQNDWSNLVEVVVHDKYSGTLVFSKPSPTAWTIALSGGSGHIQSRKAVTERGAVERSQYPVGSGPYRVSRFDVQQGVTLERNPDYTGDRPATFDICNLQYIKNPKTAELALRAGEIDFTEMTSVTARELKDVEGITTKLQPGLQYVWLGMNQQRAPLDNLKLRQAIRLALNVDEMLLAGYQGDAPRLNTMIPSGVMGHWDDAPVYHQDLEQAKALMAESGVSGPITLKLTILSDPAYQNMALVAQAYLAEIGVTVEIDQREGGTFWSAGKDESGELLEMFMIHFNGHPDPNFNTRWFLANQIGNWNWQRFDNAEYDALHEDAISTVDPEERAAKVVEMQKIVDASASMVWLTNGIYSYGHASNVQPVTLPNGTSWMLHRWGNSA